VGLHGTEVARGKLGGTKDAKRSALFMPLLAKPACSASKPVDRK